MSRFLIGAILGVLLLPAAAFLSFKYGNIPVAVADQPFPYERQITHEALNARIDREMVQFPPVQPDEKNFVAGAHIYVENCAFCHGYHARKSEIGSSMFPDAPPLWVAHRDGKVVGVSDDPPGETYWKIANGIRLTGMPSYRGQLTDNQMWQVAILLANADKPLPPAALQILEPAALRAAAPAAPAARRK